LAESQAKPPLEDGEIPEEDMEIEDEEAPAGTDTAVPAVAQPGVAYTAGTGYSTAGDGTAGTEYAAAVAQYAAYGAAAPYDVAAWQAAGYAGTTLAQPCLHCI
jgi:hypothetical protein